MLWRQWSPWGCSPVLHGHIKGVGIPWSRPWSDPETSMHRSSRFQKQMTDWGSYLWVISEPVGSYKSKSVRGSLDLRWDWSKSVHLPYQFFTLIRRKMMMHFRNIQAPPLQTRISERLCGSLAFHPRFLWVWLVVSGGSLPSSLLGEKIWNPVSFRTETV